MEHLRYGRATQLVNRRPTLKLLGCAVRLVMRPLHLASPPRPMTLDFHPQRDAQEGADENDKPEDREVLDRRRDRDRADDVGGNQKLQSQQNATPEVRAIMAKCG